MLHTAYMARMDKLPRARPHYRPTMPPPNAGSTTLFVAAPEVLEPQPASREGELQGQYGRPPEAYKIVACGSPASGLGRARLLTRRAAAQ